MPRRRSLTAAETEARIQEACKGIEESKFESVNHAAKVLDLNVKTLRKRLAGGKSRTEAHAWRQALTPAEEIALVRWITRITATGYPATHPMLREMAHVVRLRRVAQINDSSIELVSYPPLGKDWVQRFLQ